MCKRTSAKKINYDYFVFTDGMAMTIYTLNMFVHTVMYSYYFASLFIGENKFVFIKKSITIMQMVSESENGKQFQMFRLNFSHSLLY